MERKRLLHIRPQPSCIRGPHERLGAAHLVTVQCVLRRPGGDRNCVGLAAAITLAVQVLSIPGDTRHFEFLTLLESFSKTGEDRPPVIGERTDVFKDMQVSLRDCCYPRCTLED